MAASTPSGPRLSPLAGQIASVLAALAAAATGAWLDVPLAWLLLPLLVSAICSIAGLRTVLPRPLVRVGQVGLGTSIGLNMSAAALAGLVALLPAMLATVAVSVTIAAVASFVLARLARIDLPTAFFASLPGGLVEMSEIGVKAGARAEIVALVQAIRVGLIVVVIPLALIGLGAVSSSVVATRAELPLLMVLPVVAVTTAGALLARLVRLNNAFILGAMFAAALLTATSLVDGRMPGPLFAAAQFVMGYSLGARFQRAILARLPRVALAGLAVLASFSALLAIYAFALAVLVRQDPAVMVLATAIGGASEMAITAQILHLEVAIVVVFHLVRAFIVNGFATYFWAGFNRIGLFAYLDRTFPARPADPD